MRDKGLDNGRPQAPHLQIYRWPITMAMSIAHRATGIALYFGTLFLTIWLIALAYDESCFQMLQNFCHSILGKVFLFLYSFALMHHLFGGVRHLIWDFNPNLLEKHIASKLAWGTILCSVFSTILIWMIAFFY